MNNDLISRDAVLDACSQSINILDAMSRIEDLPSVTPKQEPCDVYDEYGNYKYPSDVELTEPNTATSMPCEDAISRQAVLDEFELDQYHDEYCVEHGIDHSISMEMVRIRLHDLPSVTPKQRTGHWIKHNTFEKWECSCCGVQFRFPFKEHYFCPNCAAKMEEQADDKPM